MTTVDVKPTVLMVHSNAELYGADFILHEVAVGLLPQASVSVALPCEGPLATKLRESGVHVIILRDSILRRGNLKPERFIVWVARLVADVFALRRFVVRNRVDLLYSNTAAVITGAIVAKLCGVRHVYHIHEIIQSPPWLARFIARLVQRSSDEVVAVSHAVRRQLELFRQPGDAPVTVIHNGLTSPIPQKAFDRDVLRGQLGADPHHVLFGVVGRIHPWKGQAYFVEAAGIVARRFPEARFVIVGGTYAGYEYLVSQVGAAIEENGLSSVCRLLPHRTDIADVMQALDVAVVPSTLPDPLPTVVLEAMAAARPVVATNHGGAPEMVSDSETGFLVPWNDPARFADALSSLASDKQLRLSMGTAGKRREQELFGHDRFIREIRSLVSCHLLAATGERRH